MANICPNCGSADTQVGIDNSGCLSCGRQFNTTGEVVANGPGATTRAVLEQRLAPRSGVVAGNLADLQRAGAEVAVNDGTFEDAVKTAVVAAPALDPEDDGFVTAAQHEAARGEFTRETERTGDLEAPVAADPPKEKGAKVEDPGSQSPRIISEGEPEDRTTADTSTTYDEG